MKTIILLVMYCLVSAEACIYNRVVVCEGSDVKLECNQQETMNITKAYYGRTDGKIKCGSDLGLPIVGNFCISLNAFGLLGLKCNGLDKCEFKATGPLFQLSCSGSKYLDVEYECIPKTVTVCEKAVANLVCTGSKVINVQKVFYGRGNTETCPHSSVSNFEAGCFDTDALEEVSNECDGKASCDILVSKDFFGDDPCPGIYKYMELQYKCI